MTSSPKYRTFWPRFWASIIDTVLFLPLALVDHFVWTTETHATLRGFWFLIQTFAFPLYSVIFHAVRGQTIGKRVTGVIVTDLSERPLSTWQALVRDVLPLALALHGAFLGAATAFSGRNPFGNPEAQPDPLLWLAAAWLAAELVTMLTNSKRRALHDFIARSVVLRTHAVTTGERAA